MQLMHLYKDMEQKRIRKANPPERIHAVHHYLRRDDLQNYKNFPTAAAAGEVISNVFLNAEFDKQKDVSPNCR